MKKKIKVVMTSLIILLVTDVVSAAGYSGHVNVNRIRLGITAVLFGTDTQPANTCSNWGEYFKLRQI